MYLTVSPLTAKWLLMKGLVYGRSEYGTVLPHTAESADVGRLSSRTSAAKGSPRGYGERGRYVAAASAISSFQLGGKFWRCDRESL